jgi:hypothetical protein
VRNDGMNGAPNLFGAKRHISNKFENTLKKVKEI